jgi:hemoglobin
MKFSRPLGIALFVMTGLIGGCSTTDTPETRTADTAKRKTGMTQQASLYQRLGEKPAITAVVDEFVARVAADSRINGRFSNTNIPRLKMNLVDQICAASGGPCTYRGRDMKTTHAGMRITNADFDALVGDLVAALNKFKVPEREKNELLAVLGPMRKDIVEAP